MAGMMQMLLILLVSNYALCTNTFSFASSYGSHMVLHRAPKQAAVWGYANLDSIGKTVDLELNNGRGNSRLVETKVIQDADGKSGTWRVQLPATPAGGPYTLSATLQGKTIEIEDLLFGDIWLCSGQSNMEMPVIQTLNASSEIQGAASYPNLRLFKVARVVSKVPLPDFTELSHNWERPTAKNVRDFSSLCWSYGRKLHQHTGVPIGLVASSWGGTPVEAWSSTQAIQECTEDNVEDVPLFFGPNEPSALWNAMIHPMLKTTITGVIWYQGEANEYSLNYDCTFTAMIRDWRMQFRAATEGQTDEEFPFGFVQLAGWRPDMQRVGNWPRLRWMQTDLKGSAPNPRMPNTFMAVSMDLPDFDSPYGSIHPRDKTTISDRLVYGVRAVHLAETQVKHKGPMPSAYKYTPQASMLELQFDDQQTPIEVRQNGGFEVCCSKNTDAPCISNTDPRWKAASISKHGNISVTLSTESCKIGHILGHRYAWRESPCTYKKCAVYSIEHKIPAPPYIKFDTLKGDDIWHKITIGQED